MAKDRVSTRDLVDTLRRLGFSEKRRQGSHVIFEHKKTGYMVTVATNRPFVPLIVLRTIQRGLEYHNILSPKSSGHTLLSDQ
jgi:predicted RNA binding protein YcfA (HicA-like mRNA interferase family)